MLDEKSNSVFWKDIGKNAASSVLAGLILAVVSKGALWMLPKIK